MQAIRKEAGGEPIQVVLHDGAPNVGGAWASEAYSQSALVLEALKLATDVLAPRGAFVTKIFRCAPALHHHKKHARPCCGLFWLCAKRKGCLAARNPAACAPPGQGRLCVLARATS